jgi:site-specific recombinase XerD
MSNKTLPLCERSISPTTPLAEAGEIWLARLEVAGLDNSEDEAELDTDERALRDEQRHHSRQTINSYRTAFVLFDRWLERSGRTQVGHMRLDDLVHYARALRKRDYDLSDRAERNRDQGATPQRLSPRTVRSYTRPLLGFLSLLESFNAISFRTEAVRSELVRVLPRTPDALAPTPPDLRRMVRYYERPAGDDDRTERLRLIRLRNNALLHMLFSSGARISEILGLNVGAVYRNRRVQSRVTVSGKGRREETIFLRRSAERAVHTYLEARGYPTATAPLFESYDRRTAGMRLSRSSAWRIVRQAAQAVAVQIELEGKHDEAELLRTTSPHTFRHFVGYHLLNEGADLAEVSQILRHRNVEVTRSFYARYKDIQLQEVHDQFSPDPS